MALNEDLTWESVGMIETSTDEAGAVNGRVREAFKGYKAERKLITQGTELYKFNTEKKLCWNEDKGNDVKISPWWTPYGSYQHDAGWQQKKGIAKNLGVSVREWGRLTSAIREDWNTLEWLLIVSFKTDVWGWFGGFAQMPRMAGGLVGRDGNKVRGRRVGEGSGGGTSLPGGGTQFYIPNLTVGIVANRRYEDLRGQ